MPSAGTRALVCLPLVAVLAFACNAAIDAVRTDSLLRQARTEMSTWQLAPAQSTIQSVELLLGAALALKPSEPVGQELLGHLSLARSREAGAANAVKAFASALRLRPVSGYTWASLAEARYRAGDHGRELEYPIAQAAALAPSEPGVQRVVADLGLAVWKELTPGAQANVERMLAAGIRRNPLELLRISAGRGRLDVACPHVIRDPGLNKRAGRYCERWEITP